MKTDIKQLQRDLKAAVMLGRPEAVDIALDGLLRLPGVASNDRMPEGFIEQVILPVGETLSGLKAAQLRPLLAHNLAVGRAVGAVAYACRFIKNSDSTQKDLRRPGNDPRPDVRLSLGRGLFITGPADPVKTLDLGTAWITQAGPRLRHTALVFLPGLVPHYGTGILDLLGQEGTDPDWDVRAALVEALNAFARTSYAEPVLDLLSRWSAEPHPNSWVICRVLAASWAIDHPSAVKSILQEISAKTGDSSDITHTLKAFKRHGAEIEL